MWLMHLWSLKLLCPMVKEEMHLQENTLYDLDLVVKVTQNVVQYPLNHMTYAPAKFEVATSNSLGEDGFTRKYIIWPWPWCQGHTNCCPVAYTSYDLCTCKLWSCYVQWFRRRRIYKKIHYLTLTPRSRSHEVLPSTLYIMWPMRMAKFEVATSKSLWGDAFTRKDIIWPLTLTLGEDTITRNVTVGRTDRQTHGRTEGRRTDFGTKLIYPIFLTKKRV